MEKRGYLEEPAEKLKAQLNLQAQGPATGNVDALRGRGGKYPQNIGARLVLAEALAAVATYEEALEIALAIVQTGKKEFVEPARKLMIDIFHLLPEDSPLVLDYRRRLSTAIF